MNGGEALVATLLEHGVDTGFCVPGESYLTVLEALRQARDLKVMAETLQHLADQARGKDTRRALADGYQQLFAELPDTAVVAKKSASLRAAST